MMEQFENNIELPINQTKKKRNIKLIVIIALIVVIVGLFVTRTFLFPKIKDAGKNATTATCTFPYSRSKCSGVKNDTVRKVQEMLNNKLKYRKKLTVNGIFDDATEKTIRYYQVINFLLPTGTINANTLERLAKATNTEYYKIQYDKNGGSGVLNCVDGNIQVILKGYPQNLSTTKLTKKNVTHTGWTVEANGFKSLGSSTSSLSLKSGQIVTATAYYKTVSTSTTPKPTTPTSGKLLSSKGTVGISETKAIKNKLVNPGYKTNNKYWSVAFNGYSVNGNVISNGTKYANGAVATYHIKGILGQKPNVNDMSKYVSNNEPSYSNMGYIKKSISSYQDLLQTIYNEIINGYPVPVKVKNAPGNEIYVIAYGLKSTDIRTSGKLSASDIAVFDTSGGGWFALGDFKECMVSGKYIIGVPKLSSAPAVKITEANITNDSTAKSRGLWLNKKNNELAIIFNNKSNGYVTASSPISSKLYNGKKIENGAVALYHIDGILGRKMDGNNLYSNSNKTTYFVTGVGVNFGKVGYSYKNYSTYQQYLQTIYNNVAVGYPVVVKARDAGAQYSYVVAYAFKASKSQRGNRANGSLSANDILVIDTITGKWSNLGNFRPLRESNGTYSLGVPQSCVSGYTYNKTTGKCIKNSGMAQKDKVSITELNGPYISGKNSKGENHFVYNRNNWWTLRFAKGLDDTKASGNHYDGAVAVYHMQRMLGFNFVGQTSGGESKGYLNPSKDKRKTYFITGQGTNFDIIGYKYYANYDYATYLRTIYTEIMRGYPVALKVKKNGKAIYVIAYAVKNKSIRTAGKLSPSDIAVIDPTVSYGWSNLGNFEEYTEKGKYVLAKHHILASAQRLYKYSGSGREYGCTSGSIESVWNSKTLCCTDIIGWVLWDTGISNERYPSRGVSTLGNEILGLKVNGKQAFKTIPGSGEDDAYSKLKPGDLIKFGNWHFQIYDDNKYMYNSGSGRYKQVQHQIYGPPGSYTIYRLTY